MKLMDLHLISEAFFFFLCCSKCYCVAQLKGSRRVKNNYLLIAFDHKTSIFLTVCWLWSKHRVSSFQPSPHPTAKFGPFQSLMFVGELLATCFCLQIEEPLCCSSCLEQLPYGDVQSLLIYPQTPMAALYNYTEYSTEKIRFCAEICCCALLYRTELDETRIHD